jgi:hypothetical protein
MIGKKLNVQCVLNFCQMCVEFVLFALKCQNGSLFLQIEIRVEKWKIVFLYTDMSYSILLLLNAFKIQYVNMLQ